MGSAPEPHWRKARSFRGNALKEVAFPLGGIGTGTVSLGGRGNLRDWEIFNRPAKGRDLPYTFFAIWARRRGARPVARVLERRLLPPYQAGFGLPTAGVSGLPRLAEARFRGAYPLARIDFEDKALPVEVRLEALNPFLPMNERDSGFPAAAFTWILRNPGRGPVEASIVLNLLNACGYDGKAVLGSRKNALFGGNLNAFVREGPLAGIRMSGPDAPRGGTLAMATLAPDATWMTRWERAGWWDDVQDFWDTFSRDGRLPDGPAPEPSPDGETDVGSVAARVTLAPGEERRIPFFLAWRFPDLANTWNQEKAVRGRPVGCWYAGQWPDAWAALAEMASRWGDLERETALFARTVFESTLPEPVLDAATANVSILRSPTCLRTADGRLNAFEGCHDDAGCCPMNCTHVWNYEQAVAHLFPALERTMRLTDFEVNTRPDGHMAFRTLLPLDRKALWDFAPAADGQMGTLLKVYREWRQCGDDRFLEGLWPAVERAMAFAWRPGGWDADMDGVMEGTQHNTYDIEFHGPNTMMGTLYLGALRACEEMARALGRGGPARRYRVLYKRGRKRHEEILWNGEYFSQVVVPPAEAAPPAACCAGGSCGPAGGEPRHQYGPGCLSDQLLGQWFARVVGLGDLLSPVKVRKALASIVRHNFRRDLSGHASVQRVYALNDEAGLLLCSWPKGGRPRYPFPYADEVWTGIEYQVAAHCIYEGLVREGLALVKAVRDRHDGIRRNPFDECECGHHYARAMSSWSLILALSGCVYDAPRGRLAFAPRIRAGGFRCFFSAGSAWGSFSQRGTGRRFRGAVEVRRGSLPLRALSLPWAARSASLAGRPLAVRGGKGELRFDPPVTVRQGQTLTVAGA